MAVIVTDAGFGPDAWEGRVAPLETLRSGEVLSAVDFPADSDPAELVPWFERLAMIRVAFPATGDGRGFSLARRLRALGFTGRLRAAGPLVADQYRAARRVGFDEIELSEAIAARQPQAQWRAGGPSYRERLTG